MPTESLAKRNVTSGTLQFKVGSDGLLEVVIPVAESKVDEAVPLIEDVFTAAMNHYIKSVNMNPRDVAQSLHKVADAIERYQLRITEAKYNGKARIPRTND